MCHNHKVLYNCSHKETIITLCGPILSPLIRRASEWPYTHPIATSMATEHDTMLSAEESNTPCPKCHEPKEQQWKVHSNVSSPQQRLEEIDIFDLEASTKNLDSLRAREHRKAKEFKTTPDGTVSVRVGPTLREHELSSTALNVFALKAILPPAPGSADSQKSDHTPFKSTQALSTTGLTALTESANKLQNAEVFQKGSTAGGPESKPRKISLSLPYTGGLGLLVLPKRLATPDSLSQAPPQEAHTPELCQPGLRAKL